jgi:hypothetical protein
LKKMPAPWKIISQVRVLDGGAIANICK